MSQEAFADNSFDPPQDPTPALEPRASTTAHQKLSFIETFVGTLLAPVQTFRQLVDDCRHEVNHLPAAFGIIVLVFAMDALRITPPDGLGWALLNVPTEVAGGVALWLLAGGIVSLTGLCFNADGAKCRASFVTLAWSFLPWLFMAPISCFAKLLGPAHVLFMIVPFTWIFFLQIVAIKTSFEMKAWQALALLLLVPPMLSWFQMMQFFQALSATLGSLL